MTAARRTGKSTEPTVGFLAKEFDVSVSDIEVDLGISLARKIWLRVRNPKVLPPSIDWPVRTNPRQ